MTLLVCIGSLAESARRLLNLMVVQACDLIRDLPVDIVSLEDETGMFRAKRRPTPGVLCPVRAVQVDIPLRQS